MDKISLRIQMLFVIIMLILLSLAVNMIIIIIMYSDALQNCFVNNSVTIGSSINAGIVKALRYGELKNISGIDELINEAKKQNRLVRDIWILDNNGKILFSTLPELIDKTPADPNSEKMKQITEIRTFQYPDFFDTAIPIMTSLKDDNINRKPVKAGYMRIQISNEHISKVTGRILTVSLIIFIVMAIIAGLISIFLAGRITIPLVNLAKTARRIADGDTELAARIEGTKEVVMLAGAFNSMTSQLRHKAENFKSASEALGMVIAKAKEIVVNLNSSSKEIEAASQQQTASANEYASSITEVSATLQELTITAKQITNNVGELVFSSEEVSKLLKESEQQLVDTVSLLDDAGTISRKNTLDIAELGKRSAIINEMVELIKDVANKTNILSINASIEASRSSNTDAGFSVVAAEIRELSKETIESAKKAETAAREIRNFLDSIISSSEKESEKVTGSAGKMKSVFTNMETIVSKLGNNNSFTQKIDISIKQQEHGSVQAADTMRQMAEIARQTAESARQILASVKNIVLFSVELDVTVSGAGEGKQGNPV